MKTDKEYVMRPGHCPHCDSQQIEGQSFEVEGNQAWQVVTCIDCNMEWFDSYRLTGYDISQNPA